MEEKLLTTKQVAEIFHVTRPTIFKMINEGKLRAFKVGHHYRFKQHEIEEDLRVNKN